MEWVSQITTVVAEMVLPGLAGQWLDRRWGTKVLGLIGFGLGLTVGIWHLLAMTRSRTAGPPGSRPGSDGTTDMRDTPGSSQESDKEQD
jgi:F0F1-type ATP synthase assembly protein I